jgi:Bacterial TniB protein
MKMNKALTIIERIVIPHTAFADAQRQIEHCFAFSAGQGAQGLAIVGESGTGKTSLLESFQSKHEPIRREDGMEAPVLRATVPSGPTVKSLAGKLLEALNAQDPERGTENEKSRRLRVLMKKSGTRMVMIDEFQHFYDRGKRQIMHNVADWLKVLIDDTRTTLVVAGLRSCRNVIDENEQLARRFLAPIHLPRFSWNDIGQRAQFVCILRAFHNEIAKQLELPALHSEQMAFRFYCSTGGLIGYLANLLKQTLRNADIDGRKVIRLHDFATAHMQSIWSSETISALPNPFERSFRLVESVDLLIRVSKIGASTEMSPMLAPRIGKARGRESVDSLLVRS